MRIPLGLSIARAIPEFLRISQSLFTANGFTLTINLETNSVVDLHSHSLRFGK